MGGPGSAFCYNIIISRFHGDGDGDGDREPDVSKKMRIHRIIFCLFFVFFLMTPGGRGVGERRFPPSAISNKQ